jgi:hypothetical protein
MAVLPVERVRHPETLGERTPVEITFSVEEYIRGSGPKPLGVYQPAAQITYKDERITAILTSGTSCGRQVAVGERFIVMLQDIDGEMLLSSGKLGGENESSYLESIRNMVSEPVVFPDTGTGPDDADSSHLPLAAATGLAFASGALLLGRRWR